MTDSIKYVVMETDGFGILPGDSLRVREVEKNSPSLEIDVDQIVADVRGYSNKTEREILFYDGSSLWVTGQEKLRIGRRVKAAVRHAF